MPLDDIFLQYPNRRHAMDHERYEWSNLFERKNFTLPNAAKVALLVTIPVEFFPLNPTGKPFKAPGSMVTNYPDFRHFTTRDYGNRVGIYRLMKVLNGFGTKANMAVNACIASRYPSLVNDIVSDGHEVVAHGFDMDTLHYGNMDIEQEKEQIKTTIQLLKTATNQPINGWMSPAYSESFNTPDLVAQIGCKYICDWSNDDMPYKMNTAFGNLIAMPVSQEISDRQIIINYHQTEDSFCTQVCDQFDALYHEANHYGSRILSVTLTPYISGLPYRIQTVHKILSYILSHQNVINLKGTEIANLMAKE